MAWDIPRWWSPSRRTTWPMWFTPSVPARRIGRTISPSWFAGVGGPRAGGGRGRSEVVVLGPAGSTLDLAMASLSRCMAVRRVARHRLRVGARPCAVRPWLGGVVGGSRLARGSPRRRVPPQRQDPPVPPDRLHRPGAHAAGYAALAAP